MRYNKAYEEQVLSKYGIMWHENRYIKNIYCLSDAELIGIALIELFKYFNTDNIINPYDFTDMLADTYVKNKDLKTCLDKAIDEVFR